MRLTYYRDNPRYETIQYYMPKAISKNLRKQRVAMHTSIGLFISLSVTGIIMSLIASNHLWPLIITLMVVASIIPLGITVSQHEITKSDFKNYSKRKQKIINKVSEPLISADGTTIRFAYEFIDAELSTIDTLVLTPDPDQIYMTLHMLKAQLGSNNIDPALTDAVAEYAKNERLDNETIFKHIQTIHSIAQHKHNDRILSFSEKFYQNVSQPIDTPYYRSLKTIQENVANDLVKLEQYQNDNSAENKNIIEQIQNEG